ncbi:solute carrier family 22 member 5-like [Toxotes jaculatrix]|uniref:solute carrier family 22 member 5-like n=1 Tax=Toxotes jaculatrix TaxID=941984 RepID=UPI001B3AA0B6|nr:solute carrier family 22 member 5-like [Toxotes jaculatrix]
MQAYEESVSFLGTWGPFQRKVFFLLCLATVPCGYNSLCVIFLLATPTHHCHIPAHVNLSQEWIQASIPVQQVDGKPERSSCSRYELDHLQNLSAMGASLSLGQNQNLSILGESPEVLLSSLKQEGCKDGWTYSTEDYQSTVVTEFNLVCNDQWKQPLTSLVYFLGGLCGCFISGQISDKFGRKPVLLGTIAMIGVYSGAVAFAPSWPIFIVLFFMLGLGQLTSYITVFILGSEILIGPARVVCSSLCLPFTFVTATVLLSGTAYVVPNWRHLSLIMTVPSLACVPLCWLLPESPRWLVSRGRLQEAELLLRSAALENRVEPPHVIFLPASARTSIECLDPHSEDNGPCTVASASQSLGFWDLLRTRNIRHITLMLWLIWFSMSVSYYGLAFNMSGLSRNLFLNYFLVSAVEIPAYVMSWLAARSLPRHLSFISFTLLGALALFLIPITVHSHPALTMFLVLLGKFGILAGIGMLYVYTGELSPTVIRNTAMSSCAMFSRVGSCVSPYLLQLAKFYEFLPWIVVGSLALLSVLLCVFLPETFRQPLPDTIEQIALAQRFRWPWVSETPPRDNGNSAEEHTTPPEIICTTYL